MSHCIQVIVAPPGTADRVTASLPGLPRLGCGGFDLLPVDRALVEQRFDLASNPPEDDEAFVLLNDAFREALRGMSSGGGLAYVETEYFGGVGGQGAAVFRGGVEIMSPAWDEVGIIDEALALLGMGGGGGRDRFDVAGFSRVRSNGDIVAMIDERT